jgi:hypothetical protein
MRRQLRFGLIGAVLAGLVAVLGVPALAPGQEKAAAVGPEGPGGGALRGDSVFTTPPAAGPGPVGAASPIGPVAAPPAVILVTPNRAG